MSFLNTLKSALGFSTADDDTLFADTTGPDTPAAEAAAEPATAAPVEMNEVRRQAIFDHVVAVFNSALPDFLSRTADPAAQTRELYAALDQGLKEYLDTLADAARAYSESQWRARQQELTAELEAVKVSAADIERRSKELQQSQLSADRQKRALTERVHDLESQLSRLEAEREQYELENRSLVNRLKVASVQGEDAGRALAEMESLRAQVRQLQLNPDAAVVQERDRLRQQLDEVLGGQESMREQVRVANQMLDDMRRRHKEEETRAAERQGVIDTLNDKLRQQHELIVDFEKSLDKFEEYEQAIRSRDERIASLERTVADNLRQQAQREHELQSQIEALRPPTVVAEMTVDFATPVEAAPRISEDDIQAMEATFETDEWFTKTPPAPTPSMRPPQADGDFGYQAPQRRKTHNDNPAQLSLF